MKVTSSEALILRCLEVLLKSRPAPNSRKLVEEIDEALKESGQRYREPDNSW